MNHSVTYISSVSIVSVSLRVKDYSGSHSLYYLNNRETLKDYKTEEEVRVQQRAVDPVMNEMRNTQY
jgi:hypothetical protein